MATFTNIVEDALNTIVKDRGQTFSANIILVPFSSSYPGLQIVTRTIDLYAAGQTALNTSIIRSLQDLSGILNASNRVITVIITDGHNNCGGEEDDVKTWVGIAENTLNWDVLFLGTNQDAYRTANRLGIKAGKSLSFAANQAGFEHMLNTLNNTITRWVGNNIAGDHDFIRQEAITYQKTLGAQG
jgi:hypothetical protein